MRLPEALGGRKDSREGGQAGRTSGVGGGPVVSRLQQCGSLNENVPHGVIIFAGLSPQLMTYLQGLGGVTLLEGIWSWKGCGLVGGDTSLEVVQRPSVSFSCCCLWLSKQSSQLLLQGHDCLCATTLPAMTVTD